MKHHRLPAPSIDLTGALLFVQSEESFDGFTRIAIAGRNILQNPNTNEIGERLGYGIKCDFSFVSAGLPDASGNLGPVHFDFYETETTTAYLWEQTIDGWVSTGVSCRIVIS